MMEGFMGPASLRPEIRNQKTEIRTKLQDENPKRERARLSIFHLRDSRFFLVSDFEFLISASPLVTA
jgi:hypothetical protein